MTSIRRIPLAAAAALALSGAGSALADHGAVNPNLGTPVHAESFDRQIEIGPGTRWANVTRNETVKFVLVNGDGSKSSFVWRFDTLGTPVIDLNALAPAGAQAVKIYVARDPKESA
jgi:hypothetical protein